MLVFTGPNFAWMQFAVPVVIIMLAPAWLMLSVALAASMAVMMPVATSPNAIGFSYEELHLGDMTQAGFWLNISAIAVSFRAMYYLAGRMFGLPV